MDRSTQRVLNDLRRRTKAGVSLHQYAKGFALRSRVAELRALGFNIHTVQHPTTRIATYFLISEPQVIAVAA